MVKYLLWLGAFLVFATIFILLYVYLHPAFVICYCVLSLAAVLLTAYFLSRRTQRRHDAEMAAKVDELKRMQQTDEQNN